MTKPIDSTPGKIIQLRHRQDYKSAISQPEYTYYRNRLVTLREENSYTQDDLAKLGGITRNYIIRCEQLLYVTPSTDYLTALSEISGIPVNGLADIYKQQRYHAITHSTNQLNANLFSQMDGVEWWRVESKLKDMWEGFDPWKVFRDSVLDSMMLPISSVGFARIIYIHPSQLANFERAHSAVPSQVRDNLELAGVPADFLDRLDGMIHTYKQRLKRYPKGELNA